MANTYYDSELTAEEIEEVLEAINGILTQANNEKVLAINNGKIEARSVQWGGGSAVLETLSVTENGDYTPEAGVDGFDEVHVAVPNSYSASDEGKVVNNGALTAQTERASQITQNGTYDTTLNNEVTVNVSGGSAVVQSLSVTQNGTYNPPSGVDGYAPVTVNVPGGGSGASTDYVKGGALIPVMTSNTTPSGVVSASSYLGGNFAAFMAFNGVEAQSTMQQGWLASASDTAPYIQYEWDSPNFLGVLSIHTANNSTTVSKTVTVEGLTQNDVWENCLASGSTVTLDFVYGTYGDNCTKYDIFLNGNSYKGIRIKGNESFYGGTGKFACTFSEVQVYAAGSGLLPGLGYYNEFDPIQSFGENGNIYVNLLTGIIYQKQNGSWVQL